jgi:hypothetical protein
VAVLKVEMRKAPTLRLADSDQVRIGDQVFVIGYPGVADFDDEKPIMDRSSLLEPTVNDGSVSARKSSVDGTPLLQTNAAVAPGNSGGPALNERGEVVGLATLMAEQYHGFCLLVASNTAAEFLRQAGANNREGLVDALWTQALEAYWSRRYSRAQDLLTEIVTLHDDHSAARKLMAECQDRIEAGEDRGSYVALVLTFVALATLGCGVMLVWRLRRRAKGAPAAAQCLPGATPAAPPARKATEVYDGTPAARLICMVGPLEGKVFGIGAGVTLGREAEQAQIVIDDPQVSGQHAWIGAAGESTIVRDCGSTNGTFLNDDLTRRIKEVELKDGDTLTLGAAGRVKFQFRNQAPEA